MRHIVLDTINTIDTILLFLSWKSCQFYRCKNQLPVMFRIKLIDLGLHAQRRNDP